LPKATDAHDIRGFNLLIELFPLSTVRLNGRTPEWYGGFNLLIELFPLSTHGSSQLC